jgi:hypothetical protein
MGVTEYLKHARDTADLADQKTGAEREKIQAIALEWLRLAGLEAKDIADLRSKLAGR